MAKNRHPLLRLGGTVGSLTFVESKAYGRHVRSARGTYKEAKCNQTFEKNCDKAPIVTDAGRPLLQIFKDIGGNFVQSNL